MAYVESIVDVLATAKRQHSIRFRMRLEVRSITPNGKSDALFVRNERMNIETSRYSSLRCLVDADLAMISSGRVTKYRRDPHHVLEEHDLGNPFYDSRFSCKFFI